MGAGHNGAGLTETRFFLGFTEAAVAPSFSIITSMWYMRPEQPAWFLSSEDWIKAVARVKEDSTGLKHDRWKRKQMWEALQDPRSWFAVLLMLCNNIPKGGILNVSFVWGKSARPPLLSDPTLKSLAILPVPPPRRLI